MKMWLGRAATSASPGAAEPDYQWDAGASGTPDCCWEHATSTLDDEAPAGGMACSRRTRRSEVDRFIERCAGLEVHKASVKACVRVPDGHGGRRSEIRTFRTTTAGLVLLGDWLASHQVQVVGMASTGVLLEAGLGPAGRRRRVLAAERPAPQERARPQDTLYVKLRRHRLPPRRAVGRLRA
jgi:hypothetical protein